MKNSKLTVMSPNKNEENVRERVIRHPMEKLARSNYQVWKVKMVLVLEDIGLWDEESETPVEGKRSAREIKFQVNDENLSYIQELECGKEAWKKLKDFHETKGTATTLDCYVSCLARNWEAVKWNRIWWK